MKTTRLVTFTTMLQTDGTTTVYGVFRGMLHKTHRPQREQFIDLKNATHVGQVIYDRRSKVPFDYFTAAEQWATPDAPAFDWGREPIAQVY